MKTKLLITSLCLITSSAYAQRSIPSVGMPPPAARAEMHREVAPSMPQPAIQRPMPQMNQNGQQSAVGATGGKGEKSVEDDGCPCVIPPPPQPLPPPPPPPDPLPGPPPPPPSPPST